MTGAPRKATTRIARDGRDRMLAARDATLAAGTARLQSTVRDEDEGQRSFRPATGEVDFTRRRVRLSAPHHARRVLDAAEAAARREHWRGIAEIEARERVARLAERRAVAAVDDDDDDGWADEATEVMVDDDLDLARAGWRDRPQREWWARVGTGTWGLGVVRDGVREMPVYVPRPEDEELPRWGLHPLWLLAALARVNDDVREIGPEGVGDVAATRYEGSADLVAADLVSPGGIVVPETVRYRALRAMPFVLWLDDAGRIRKLSYPRYIGWDPPRPGAIEQYSVVEPMVAVSDEPPPVRRPADPGEAIRSAVARAESVRMQRGWRGVREATRDTELAEGDEVYDEVTEMVCVGARRWSRLLVGGSWIPTDGWLADPADPLPVEHPLWAFELLNFAIDPVIELGVRPDRDGPMTRYRAAIDLAAADAAAPHGVFVPSGVPCCDLRSMPVEVSVDGRGRIVRLAHGWLEAGSPRRILELSHFGVPVDIADPGER